LRLADFIVSHQEPILQEWEAFARTIAPAAGMTAVELRNHAAIMLGLIADDLRRPQSQAQQIDKSHGKDAGADDSAGRGHGITRLESSFTIEQLFSEYRALRSSVLRLWRNAQQAPQVTDIDDIIRFDEAIDQLLAASVFSFAQAKRQAEDTEKQRRNQFLSMLAHELRNPLAPISMSASILKRARGNQALIDNASDVIARQVTHMAELVDDLLDVSRVTRGLIKVKLEAVDVRQVLDDAVEQVTPQIDARGHQLTLCCSAEPVAVRADRKRLVQVITNLLTNAAKYTPQGGQIRLEMLAHDDQVVISVDDNGIGMAPDFLPHAFELFAQAQQTSDRTGGGLGMGLALVRSLVELHDGKVACASAGLGQGSRFTVWLPRHHGSGNEVERVGTLLD
jgi:signal transduction histidine kinase